MRSRLRWLVLSAMLTASLVSAQERTGSIRGVVLDKDFEAPLGAAHVQIVDLGRQAETGEQGSYLLGDLPPGKYTLVFSRDGYVRQVRTDVVVMGGQLTDVDVSLAGEFTDMEEFVVQDVLRMTPGSEAALLELRFESPALMDSISSDLMSRAGASDAAGALSLVSGASVQEGKFAVIRGLPDRYVSSQMNGVRLPSADEDKRAVELDQFPAPILESIQVTKTFTPDQQGDASGGAVDVRLKSIPDEAVFQIKSEVGYNSNVGRRSDFLTYDGGGVSFLGIDHDRRIQTENLGSDWDGPVGTTTTDAPIDYKWSIAAGGKHVLDNGVKVGGFASLFYERDSNYYNDGVDDELWVVSPGAPLTPQYTQGAPSQGSFVTSLFDVTKASQSVKWGALGTVGVESENHKLGVTYLYTRAAEDDATLAINTRGKEFFFPGYDPNDPQGPGNRPGEQDASPYLRVETLDYTERTTSTLQFHGEHRLPIGERTLGQHFTLLAPELDWTYALSSAGQNEPDKRQFGAKWFAPSDNPFLGITPPTWLPLLPSDNVAFGNVQHIFKRIDENSDQFFLDLKLPFEQWSGEEGYVKSGYFRDHVKRTFNQDTFSNFNDFGTFVGGFNDPWSAHFPGETNPGHPITKSQYDIDYDGDQTVSAAYAMADLPFTSSVKAIGGARLESTEIGDTIFPGPSAFWFPPGSKAPVPLHPGDADTTFSEHDVLPALALVYQPLEKLTFRGSFSQTIARQTFKELTPVIQQEYQGGPIFIGNPELQTSKLKNWDLRADWRPYEGGLVSLSWFRKDVTDPIEYVQQFISFPFTTARNYPQGELTGYEVEVRQSLDHLSDALEGVSVGANATFLDSRVDLPPDEIALFELPSVKAPISSRDMTNAPDHLYNLFLTYDLHRSGTKAALFYTMRGDALVAGATVSNGRFIPSVYDKEYGTLNFTLSQRLTDHVQLEFKAKNLLNPAIEQVYRSKYIGDDVTKTSYTKGIDFTFGISGSI